MGFLSELARPWSTSMGNFFLPGVKSKGPASHYINEGLGGNPGVWYDTSQPGATMPMPTGGAGGGGAGGASADAWTNYIRGQNAGFGDWWSGLDYAGKAATAGQGNQLALMNAGRAGAPMAYGNLLSLLGNQGRTDPRMMNRTLAGIQRNTQGAQAQMQGGMQRQGFQNAGVGQALQAALGQAGAGQQAGVVADDAQRAEERRRSDLQLFMQMIGQPTENQTALAMGQYNADRANSNQDTSNKVNAGGAILGAIAKYFGSK